jgi:hypothetical protein
MATQIIDLSIQFHSHVALQQNIDGIDHNSNEPFENVGWSQ